MFVDNQQYREVEKDLIQWRRDLHQIPEIGFDLPKTTAYVRKVLEEIGIEYKELVNGSAIVGLIPGNTKNEMTVALRADMDALPIQEETGLDFASTNGNMHACGHDAHTAVLLAAAKILYKNKDILKGNVKLLFQPSEEKDGGAKPMIDEGCMENPTVDYVIGQHVGLLSQELKQGQMGYYPGTMMASLDEFTIKFTGSGGHGAYPHNAIDPITMTAAAIGAYQDFMAREVNALEPAVFTIGKIQGGTQYNIIPDSVTLSGTCRCLSPEIRDQISERIKKISSSIAEAYRGKCSVDYKYGYPSLQNNVALTEKIAEVAKEILDEDTVVELQRPSMGSEDFAFYAQEAPGTFIFWNTSKECDGIAYPNHNSKFMVDENLLIDGVKLFVESSISLLNEGIK